MFEDSSSIFQTKFSNVEENLIGAYNIEPSWEGVGFSDTLSITNRIPPGFTISLFFQSFGMSK